MTDPWAKARLAGVIGASGISVVGSRMTFVAIPWLVLVTTGSPTKMGIVAGAEMLPYVLASALGGVLIDRVGHRRTAIVSDLLSAVAMVGIAFGHRLGFSALVALVFVAGGLRGFGDNARKIMVPPIAIANGQQMARVAAVVDGMNRLSMMLGASIAGILVAVSSATFVLLVDAVTFVLAAAVISLVVPARYDQEHRRPAKEPYFTAVRAGFVHVWQDRVAFGMLCMLFFTNVFNQASGVVFIPLWASKAAGSAAAVGLVLGALGLGAVVGNVAFTIIATRVPRYATLTIAFLIGGPPRFLILGLSTDLAAVAVVTFLSGMALAAVNPIVGVSFLDRTSAEMWPRVQGLMIAVAWAGIPLGGLLGGWSVQSLGLEAALLLTSALYLAVALVPVLGYRTWRGLNAAPKPAAGVATA